MSSVFDRIRSGAGKAALEADKLRRITSIQSTIKSLKDEINQGFYRVGYVAFDLYRAERVTQPELQEACEHIITLQAQIAARERESETIRGEEYAEKTSGIQYGNLCPNGHGELADGTRFCPTCGAKAIYTPPPTAGARCTACGAAMAPAAHFCPECGQPIAEPSFASVQPTPSPESAPSLPVQPLEADAPESVPVSPVAVPNKCPQCAASLIPGAAFCPDCGYRMVSE
jgi:hypothetical protein